MFDIFSIIRRLLKIDRIKIDNVIFSFHYKVTTVILVIFSLLVTNKQLFGDPIICMSYFRNSMINMYCWIQSTFTLPALTGAVVGEEVAHPGVAHNNSVNPEDGKEPLEVRHHKYYQWVSLFLFLQAGMFYLPRYIWKSWEGGRVRSLVDDLNLPILKGDVKQKRVAIAVDYFGKNFHHHNLYAYQFFLCELLNFANVVGQFFFTDRFLGYGFSTYGPRVVEDAQQDSGHDPKDEIFPKVAKCTFHAVGASGTIARHDILCVLPLNILNEKIFVFLWFWFIVVAAVSAFGLLYRLATFSPGFRHLLLMGRSRLVPEDKIEAISRRCHIGDWFMLLLLAKNMDPFVYKEFIHDLSPALVEKEHIS
ncbi:innexin inx2-like [Panulirus ornatus]|uniref:innexin inx2-like n=1 Tax=Panulirus ornatus TaxID=150431 RepID=UPI003A865CB5